MAEVEITRKQIIVVDTVGENSYGDLTFTDKEGKEYKVGNKRKQYFDGIILPDRSVQLNYAKFKGKEYIYNADKIADMLPKSPQSSQSSQTEGSNSKPPAVERKSSPETGMWYKEMGDMIRCGDIDKNTLQGKTLRNAYYAEMLRVLGININAKEIGKEDN